MVGSPASSDGRSQRASASSSLSTSSPEISARRERQNDEMLLNAAVAVVGDALAVARKRDRFDGKPGLFRNLALDRLVQRLADLDHAARKRVDPMSRARVPGARSAPGHRARLPH